MGFEETLKALLVIFEREGIRYALMGGVALGALGYRRATMDLDFLVHRDDLLKIHAALASLGYERRHTDENVSHYAGAIPAQVGVDLIHAFRRISLEMLDRAEAKPVFEGGARVRVLKAEDIIGFKIQAIANNPAREAKDNADIEALMELFGDTLDWPRVQEYFALFRMGQRFDELRGKYRRKGSDA